MRYGLWKEEIADICMQPYKGEEILSLPVCVMMKIRIISLTISLFSLGWDIFSNRVGVIKILGESLISEG